ncbi:MnhB domain-containing protein, partial [Nocardia sp. NPDC060220]|uniref:MnhB domain-containing protein n=1 Tax=Nocardia sp. NPDC060220 TaxID=3347076 RepID=UPI00364F4FC4
GASRLPSVANAVVTDVQDPLRQGRVKLTFPWLNDAYVSDWTRCVQLGGKSGGAPRAADSPNYDPDAVSWLPAARLLDRRDRSMVLQITTRLVFPTIMVLSVYFFFAGHNAPGGGFAGGLVAGLALTLRYLAGGRYELGEALPVDAGHLLGAGLTLAAGTATASLLLGAPPLSSAIIEVTLPLLGHLKLVTAMFFDLGVYLVIVGLVLDVLRSLGARLDKEIR